MGEFERACADAGHARRQPAGQREQQAARGEQQPLGLIDLGWQFKLLREVLGEDERALRIGDFAAGACQLQRQHFAEAMPQCGTGQGVERGEGIEAEGLEAGVGGGVEAEHCHRQGVERGAPVVGGAVDVAQPACGQRCGREPEAQAQPLRFGAAADVGEQCVQAAEQAQAAADFEQQPVGRGKADVRGEVAAPAGERFEQGLLARRLAFVWAQRGSEREGVGQAHAGADAGLRGEGVCGDDTLLGNGGGGGRQAQHLDREPEEVDRQPARVWGGFHGASGGVKFPVLRRWRVDAGVQAGPRQRALDGQHERGAQGRATTFEELDLHAVGGAAHGHPQRRG